MENGPLIQPFIDDFPIENGDFRGSAGALFGGLGLVQAQLQDEAGRPEAAGGFGGEPTGYSLVMNGYSMVIQWLFNGYSMVIVYQ